MKQTAHAKTAKQFTLILQKYHLTKKELNPELLDLFPDMIEALTNQIIGFKNILGGSAQRAEKVEWLMDVFAKEHEGMTLNILAKKVCLLFMLLRRMIQEDVMDQTLEGVFQRQITIMLKQDIPALASPQQKRASSINKIYNYIRELSGSKEKQNSGRTTLQCEGDRGALKEILTGIFQPFCCYLLRMLQNHQPYHFVLRRNSGKMERPLQWAMINSAKSLGQIILQLHRFGRYFINDLKGILIYLTYLASKDTSLYYDALMTEAQRQAAAWKLKIEEEDFSIKEGIGTRRIVGMSQFKESKGFIDQLVSIRQKIHYIFGNKYLKDYRFFFAKPQSYELRVDSSVDIFEPILDYDRRASKWQLQSQSLSKVDANEESFLYLAQNTLLSSKELLRKKSEDFDVQEEELQYKLATTSPSKPRMNSWLSRNQRNKHARVPAIIICDKEDIISTNE